MTTSKGTYWVDGNPSNWVEAVVQGASVAPTGDNFRPPGAGPPRPPCSACVAVLLAFIGQEFPTSVSRTRGKLGR
jgi:hypothetical protein